MHDGECERSNGPPIARSLQQGPVGGIKNGSRGRDLAPAVGSLGDLRWKAQQRGRCADYGPSRRRARGSLPRDLITTNYRGDPQGGAFVHPRAIEIVD